MLMLTLPRQSSSVNSYRPQTPPRATSASSLPLPSQQSYSRRTSRNTPTDLNSVEVQKMIEELQAIPQAMQDIERQKAELERMGEAQQRRIEYLEDEVDRLVLLERAGVFYGMKCTVY